MACFERFRCALKKTERILISEKTFGEMPTSGAFSNQFIEGMKQIYELEPFIEVRMIKPRESIFAVKEELLASTRS